MTDKQASDVAGLIAVRDDCVRLARIDSPYPLINWSRLAAVALAAQQEEIERLTKELEQGYVRVCAEPAIAVFKERTEKAEREIAYLEMLLDASCSAEELRQTRERAKKAERELAEARKDAERLRNRGPWKCIQCSQLNNGWADSCGRCQDDAATGKVNP